MTKRYLADMIGEDYKRWQPGQTVLAATTTGSGKTWFVLNRFLYGTPVIGAQKR